MADQIKPMEGKHMSSTKLISLEEAAQDLGISKRTLERRIADGLIAKVKIGKRALIAMTELERFIRKQTKAVQ